MRLFPAILANLFLVVAAIGFGSLLRRLFPKTFSTLDRIALTLLGGLGILGTILFCVGQIWFSRLAITLILLLGSLLSVPSLASAARQFRSVMSQVSFPVLPTLVVSSVLLITAVGGLALPVGDMNGDEIAYHYYGPKVWLRNALIRPNPDEVLTYFPVAVETQYAALMSLGGERAPGFLAFTCIIVGLLIAASLAIRSGLDPVGAWWTATIVATMPAVCRGAFRGFVDVLFAGFILAAARCAFDAEEAGSYILFGIFSGLAMGTKYTGIVAWEMLVLSSFLISVWNRPRNYAVVLKWLAISCAIAAAVASPFYLRNWILYDSPIYPPTPLMLRLFTPKNFPPAVLRELLAAVVDTGQGMGTGFRYFLLLPFNLTYHTANFRGAGGIGLAPLALAPIGFAISRSNRFAMGLVLFSVLETTAWFATAQVSRYLIPIYMIAAIFAMIGWDYARQAGSRYARAISATVLAISIVYGIGMIARDRRDDARATLFGSYEAARRTREIPRIEIFNYVNYDSSVSKVLILDPGLAAYFIDKPFIKPFGRWGERTLPGVNDASSAMAKASELHISHVISAASRDGSFGLPENPAGLTLVFESQDERVFKID
jgi:hypothetical protein